MDEPIKHGEDQHGFLAGLVIGALAGGAAALLLSPKNGKEMRTALRQFADDWKDEAAELSEDVKDILGQFQEALEDGVSGVRELAEKPVARAVDRAEEVREDLPERVGQGYQEVRQSVQEMIDSWRSQQPDQHRFGQREEVREVAPQRESSRPEPEDWPTYPTGNGDYYHNFKGGSVSAVAEPEVDGKRQASSVNPSTSLRTGREETEEAPGTPKSGEKLSEFEQKPSTEDAEVKTKREGRIRREEDAPFLAPKLAESDLLRVGAKEPVAEAQTTKELPGEDEWEMRKVDEDLPSFMRESRATASSSDDEAKASKPARKLFFKRK